MLTHQIKRLHGSKLPAAHQVIEVDILLQCQELIAYLLCFLHGHNASEAMTFVDQYCI